MQFFNTSPEVQQRIAVLVPLVALSLSIFVVYPNWQSYQELKRTIEKQQKELDVLKATPVPPPSPITLAVPALASEPPQFLGQVSAIAAETHCYVSGFDLTPISGGKEGDPIQTVRAKITMEAQYAEVRNFVSRLARAPRLLVITDMSLTSVASSAAVGRTTASGSLQAAVEIERYLLVPEQKETPASPAK